MLENLKDVTNNFESFSIDLDKIKSNSDENENFYIYKITNNIEKEIKIYKNF